MDTKTAMEIGHSGNVLVRAQELVREAYQLIEKDPIAKRHIQIMAKVGWNSVTWNKLNEEWKQENPESTEIWHLRAFDYFNLPIGVCMSTNGMTETCGG